MDQISTTIRKTPTSKNNTSYVLKGNSQTPRQMNNDLEIQRLLNVIEMREDENELIQRKLG